MVKHPNIEKERKRIKDLKRRFNKSSKRFKIKDENVLKLPRNPTFIKRNKLLELFISFISEKIIMLKINVASILTMNTDHFL